MTNSFRTTFCTVRTLEPERCSSEAQNRNPILIPSFSLPNPYPFVNPVFFNTTLYEIDPFLFVTFLPFLS